MWRELPPLHERQSVLIQHREGKWEASWSWAQKLLAQEKYFDTIENTCKKQKDCNKYCFIQKNIAQAVTNSTTSVWLNWLWAVPTGSSSLLKLAVTSWKWFFLGDETSSYSWLLKLVLTCCWNWMWLAYTCPTWLMKLVVTGSFWMLKLNVISLN